MAIPFAAAALRVGSLFAKSGQAIKSGARVVSSNARDNVARTREKIAKNQKVVNREKADQKATKKRVDEEIKRREKEGTLEQKKGKKIGNSLTDNLLKKPIFAITKLIQAWVIKNLPKIVENIRVTAKKVRVLLAATKKALGSTKGIFDSMVKVTVALAKNIATFDFNDSKGRLQDARDDYEKSMEEFETSLNEFGTVWDRSESELDEMLKELDDGGTFTEAVDKALLERARGERAAEPMTGIDGTKVPSARINDSFDPNTRALLNTIRYAEGTAGPNGYNTWFGGRTDMDLSKMTITEVVAEQRRRLASGEATYGQYTSAAVGAYQIMKPEEAAKTAGLNPDTTKFTPDVQDQLAVEAFLKDQAKLSQAEIQAPISKKQIAKIAPVWASLPKEDGKSAYGQPVKSYGNLEGVYNQNLGTAQSQQSQGAQPQAQAPVSTSKSGGGTVTPSAVVDEANVSKNQHKTIGITSGFGMRWGRMHKGIDIGTTGQRGVLVGMRAKGRVILVSNDPTGWGKYVVIYVPSMGMSFLFGHMAQIFVKQGSVYNGEAIGEIGNTGRSTGEHLHFEAIVGSSVNGKRIDPMPYLTYLSVGKKTKTMGTGNVNTTKAPTLKAESTAEKVSEVRTSTNRRGRKVIIMRETQIMLTSPEQ